MYLNLKYVQDMLSMCVPKPEMLINYLDELLDNISSSSPSVRSAAYSCLTRLLRHSPSTWAAVLPSYLAALEVDTFKYTVAWVKLSFSSQEDKLILKGTVDVISSDSLFKKCPIHKGTL